MSEWREHKLGDFIEVKHGFAFSGTGITDQPTRNILVTPGNFNIGGGFKNSKFKYFNYEFPNEYILKTGDIVVTMTDLSQETDTLGYAAKIPMYDGINFLHNQRIGLVQFKGSEANEDFIYWLMRTKEYQSFIVGSASGTSIMHTSPSRIKEYQFLLPSRSEQAAIAEVLSSLDDKIDLLHRQNKTLEQLAETLFRQWFVEEAEESWETKSLGDLGDFYNGKSRPSESGLIPVYGGNGILGYANVSNYAGKSIVIGRVGAYCGSLYYENRDIWVSDNAILLKAKYDSDIYFIFYFLKSIDLNL
ncbi:MAG: restriction endonuclease subunit S, partial [Cyclobacteriaceae bacterium]